MSTYQVLARKWRPQNFADLIGQEHVSRTLANAITSGRIHHAFLFTGARGVGKTSAARILAKALNCENGLTSTPCNICSSCTEITGGQGIDVIEIDGASNRGINEVREVIETVRYLPSRSRFKIFIIDEVHMLTTEAFNALLKTLEEPPPHAKFIFATTEPHKIPITILSRCQRFDFRKIALTPVIERLRAIVDVEGISISDRALGLVARRGEGSMRDSLSTLDQVIAFCGETVNDQEVQGLLGLVDRRLLLDAVEAIIGRESRLALETLRRVDDQGYAFRQFCQELVEALRGLVLLKVTGDPGDLLDVTADEKAQLTALADRTGLEDLQRALTLLMKTETELANAAQPRLQLEMVMVRLCHLPPGRDVSALIAKIEDLERRLAGRTAAAPAPSAVPPSARPTRPTHAPPREDREPPPKKAEAPPTPADAGPCDWPGLIRHVRAAQRPRIATALDQASVLSFEPPALRLGLTRGSFALDALQDDATLTELRALCSSYFGAPADLRIAPLDAAAAGTSAPLSLQEQRRREEESLQQELHSEARAHPLVRAACDILEGEIIAIRPLDRQEAAGDNGDGDAETSRQDEEERR